MPEQFTNDALTTLASNLAPGDLVMHTTGPISGSPAFPATGTFRVKIVSTGELCAVTGVSGNDFTISRQDGGSALSGTVLAGATIEQVLTKEAMAAAFVRADQATAAVISAQGFQASGVGQFSTPGRFLGVLSVQGPPTSGTYLTGDSGFDSVGMPWFCTAGGTPGTWKSGVNVLKARARGTVTTSVPSASFTKCGLQTEDYDPSNSFDNVTNFRFTVVVPGDYQVFGAVGITPSGAGDLYALIYKNGTEFLRGAGFHVDSSSDAIASVADQVQLAVNDYLELWTFHNIGSTQSTDTSTAACPRLTVRFLGSS